MEFNKKKQTTEDRKTTNLAGGEAYEVATPELELTKLVINNLLEDRYYEEDIESLNKVADAFERAAEKDSEFPLKLAYYAREKHYLRDISQLLLVLSARKDETKKHVEKYAPHVIQRADEPCTVVAMWDELFGGTLPKPLKKGINRALHNFDKYQYDKYDNRNREVNIRDVINRTHPKPQDELREEIFERLMKGDLDDYPDVESLDESQGATWETVISEEGNTEEAWKSVLDRMGIFAKTRNIRNMKEAGLDSEEILTDEDLEHAKNSKMYPFRFYQAYRAVKQAGVSDPHIEDWLSDAIDATAENLPDYLENTLAVADTSGSMRTTVSNNSDLQCMEIGALFAATVMRKGSEAGAFASNFEFVDAHHRTPTLELQDKVQNAGPGGGTQGYKVIQTIRKQEKEYDRVILFTDMQLWGGSLKDEWDKYKAEVNQEASLYLVDLAHYGELQTPEGYPDVYNLNGWNSKVLDWIEAAENEQVMVNEVKNVEVGENEA